MIIVSDTNVLSSFAAGEAIEVLLRLFSPRQIGIPPSVYHELQEGVVRGRTYLDPLVQIIGAQRILILPLTTEETQLMPGYPAKLNLGEREALALVENRRGVLLSNDKRAVRYCQDHQLSVITLPNALRRVWTQQVLSQVEVRSLIEKMKQREDLVITQAQLSGIFAPRRQRR